MSELSSAPGAISVNVPDGTAVSKYTLVNINSSGDLAVAGATDDVIGVCQNDVPSDAATRARGNNASVLPVNWPGAMTLTAAGAVTMGAPLFKAASGKVDDTGTESIGRKAVQAAAADGDLILTVPFS